MRPHAGASVFTTRRRPWRETLVVEGGDPDPRAEKKKGNVAWGLGSHACV